MSALNNNKDPNPKHTLFCKMTGMPPNFDSQPAPSMWNVFSTKDMQHPGIYPRVRRSFQLHTLQYWFVGCMSNSLLWLQICFGATLTALGGVKSAKVSIAIIVLGALQTVFGGLLTYFKSRNQPNRSRQYRVALRQVLNAIENAESMLRDPSYEPPAYYPRSNATGSRGVSGSHSAAGGVPAVAVKGVEGIVLRLMDMYVDATNEAESNYPDFWQPNRSNSAPDQTIMMQGIFEQLRKNGSIQETGHRTNRDSTPMSDIMAFKPLPSEKDMLAESRSTTTRPSIDGNGGRSLGSIVGHEAV